MSVDSPQAALYARAVHELVRQLVAGLPEALRSNPFARWEPPATAAPPEQRVAAALDGWIAADDRTFLPPGQTWADAARQALSAAAAEVDGRSWGDLHPFSPLVLGGAERLRLGPVAGGSHCVMATNQVGGVSTAALVGSTARYLWDLADRSRSGWVVPLGAHGEHEHAHGRDQLEAWRTGRLLAAFEDGEAD
jgi:penicillin amidase